MECERVGDMSLFHTGASKHLKLEEFDSAQQQASVQVYIIISMFRTNMIVLWIKWQYGTGEVCFPSFHSRLQEREKNYSYYNLKGL